MNIGMVGGGRAAAVLMDYFTRIPSVDVGILCDLSEDAPGVLRARELGIKTTKDLSNVLRWSQLEILVELTGSSGVQAKIFRARQETDSHWDVITSGGAKILCEMIDAQTRQIGGIAEDICRQLKDLSSQAGHAQTRIHTADGNVAKLLREAHMVTVNGRIEASRLGQAGAGFAALVGRLDDLIKQITEAAKDISAASDENRSMLEQLSRSEQHLREQLVQGNTTQNEPTAAPAKSVGKMKDPAPPKTKDTAPLGELLRV
ncbi:MAG: hypothetical protein JXA11_12775 [Phycisphaerae bacterium]|nr:hypothetical protein [Phycisphaerae bacterium]